VRAPPRRKTKKTKKTQKRETYGFLNRGAPAEKLKKGFLENQIGVPPRKFKKEKL
jgi:hypothetical protein